MDTRCDTQFSGAAPDPELPCHDAATLTNGGATAHIALDGQVYTLRITRTRKLILTK
ncbi:MAG: hemin uptake protein HemP [Rhodobacteraceae bacterium]|nr:hemin uptake protein HemP [Paracoccaceae bacterium]